MDGLVDNHPDDDKSFAELFEEQPFHVPGESSEPKQALGSFDPDASFSGEHWFPSGSSPKKIKRLQGQNPQRRHDYHGLLAEQAWHRLNEDLAGDLASGLEFVEVIHGKGEGILKSRMRAWLKSCRYVKAFAEPKHNSGSVIVELKKLAS